MRGMDFRSLVQTRMNVSSPLSSKPGTSRRGNGAPFEFSASYPRHGHERLVL